VIRLFRRQKPAPLLSDAEMAKLHEEIFEEPVDAEYLFAMYSAVRPEVRPRCEWVMDRHTLNRVRRACLRAEPFGFTFRNLETTRAALPEDRLLGLPIVIEPFAKLALRVRES